jgi:hypothetical protein
LPVRLARDPASSPDPIHKPMIGHGGFRRIPGMTGYAVNREGEVASFWRFDRRSRTNVVVEHPQRVLRTNEGRDGFKPAKIKGAWWLVDDLIARAFGQP